MTDRPILFSGEMVKAILEGRKTMTRRVMKVQPPEGYVIQTMPLLNYDDPKIFYWDKIDGLSSVIDCPYGAVKDKLWVRETWSLAIHSDGFCSDGKEKVHDCPIYKADLTSQCGQSVVNQGVKWRPSIFMPRWASRITLQITNIRAERVQDISAIDAMSEGINVPPPSGVNMPPSPEGFEKWGKAAQDKWIYGQARDTYIARLADVENQIKTFRTLWDSINGKNPDKCWDANPWVWVVEFERV